MADPRYDGMIRLRGLDGKASALLAAQTSLNTALEARRQAAIAMLQTAYGPWAPEFRIREERLLDKLAGLWFTLGYSGSACAMWPAPSYYGGSPTGIGNAVIGKSTLVPPGGGDSTKSGVNTTKLSDYIEVAQRQHESSIAHVQDHLNVDGVTGEMILTMVSHPENVPDADWHPLTPAMIRTHLEFLKPTDADFMGLSSDVLTYANEHLEAFNRTTGRPPRPPGGTDRNGPPSGGRDDPPPPPTELPDIPIEDALPALAANLARFDRPGLDGSPPDGRISLEELKAAAADESLPPDLRALAATLAANEALFAEIAALNQREDTPPTITAGDLQKFMGSLPALEVFVTQFGTFDQPSPDGIVSLDELRAAAVDSSISPQARESARFMLDHPQALQRLATYGEPPGKPSPLMFILPGEPPPTRAPDTTSFTADNARDMLDDYRKLLGLPPLPPEPPTLPPPPPQSSDGDLVAEGVPRL